MNPGLAYALIAFSVWGLFPLYLRQLDSVPPIEIVLHRSAWSLLFVLALLAWRRQWGWLGALTREPRRALPMAASAVLLSVNWLLYVWAIHSHQVLEASLGYFINPLVNVVLGVLVLRERLRPVQWLAVALAALGVGWLAVHTGRLPWIALALATSFGLYGLLRKTSAFGALEGLTLENLLLAPLVLPALVLMTALPGGALTRGDAALTGWLLLSGPLTALPLLCFAAAARRLTLASLGLIQYLSPSLQFVLGVWVFGEPMQPARLAGFGFIWCALLIYSVDAVRRSAAAR